MSLAQAILIAWIPLVVYLFVLLPPRRAVLVAFIVGWLFLPVYVGHIEGSAFIRIRGFPNLEKSTVTSLSVLLGVILFDRGKLLSYRLHWLDLPVMLFCIAPFFSSMYNAAPDNPLGFYDGIAESFGQSVIWGLPYLIGRVYFTDTIALRELGIAVLLGGLVYVPVAWWDMLMSSGSLHSRIYGYLPTNFSQQLRSGGYRPVGFMPSGLSMGMWMTVSSVIGFWLWHSKSVRRLFEMPVGLLLIPLILTSIFSKAVLAIMLLVFGLFTLLATRYLRTSLALPTMMVIIIGFLVLRAPGTWQADELVRFAGSAINESRAQSLHFRIHHENLLAARAMEQPVFGWGGWSRSRVLDDDGRDLSITDSLWIITFGKNGLVGLVALVTTLLLPPLIYLMRYPAHRWHEPHMAAPSAIAVILVLFMTDNLLNSFPNPVFTLMAGALVGVMTISHAALVMPASAYMGAVVTHDLTPAQPRRRRRAGEAPMPRHDPRRSPRSAHPLASQGDTP